MPHAHPTLLPVRKMDCTDEGTRGMSTTYTSSVERVEGRGTTGRFETHRPSVHTLMRKQMRVQQKGNRGWKTESADKKQLRAQQRIPAHLLIQPASRKDGRRVKIPYMEENRTIVDQYGKVRTRSSQGKPSMRKNFITLPCRWGRGI